MPTANAEGYEESKGSIGKVLTRRIFMYLQIGAASRRLPSACSETLKKPHDGRHESGNWAMQCTRHLRVTSNHSQVRQGCLCCSLVPVSKTCCSLVPVSKTTASLSLLMCGTCAQVARARARARSCVPTASCLDGDHDDSNSDENDAESYCDQSGNPWREEFRVHAPGGVGARRIGLQLTTSPRSCHADG